MRDHRRQPFEQRDAHLPVGVREELDHSRHDLLLVLLLVEYVCDLEERLQRTRRAAAVLERVVERGEHLVLCGALVEVRHALGELGEETVLLDGVLDVERLEEELQRDVLLLEDWVGEELGGAQPRLRVGREHPLKVLLQRRRHLAEVLEVRERADRPAEDFEHGAAKGPPVGGDGDALEHVGLAAAELGRLVKLGERLLGRGKVRLVRGGRLCEQLEAAQLPVHALVHEKRRDADLAVDDVAVDVEELDRGGERVDAPRDAARRLLQLVQHLHERLHRLGHDPDDTAALLVEVLAGVEALEHVRVLDGPHLLGRVPHLRQLHLRLLILQVVKEDRDVLPVLLAGVHLPRRGIEAGKLHVLVARLEWQACAGHRGRGGGQRS